MKYSNYISNFSQRLCPDILNTLMHVQPYDLFVFNQLLDAVKMGWNILIVYGCGCMSRKSILQLHSPLTNVQMGHFLLNFSTNGEEEMCSPS